LLECVDKCENEVPSHEKKHIGSPILKNVEADDADLFEELSFFIEGNDVEIEHGQEQIEDLFLIIQQGYQLLGGGDFTIEHV